MKISLTAIFLLISCSVFAGTIKGNVKAQPRPEAMEDVQEGKYENRKYKFLDRINYDELKDFVVYVDQPIPDTVQLPPKTLQVVIQKDGDF